MQSEKRKRSIRLLDDGELADQHVDPHLNPAVFPSTATKAKRRLDQANRPSPRIFLITIGLVAVSYSMLYALGDIHLTHFNLVGVLPIVWCLTAFLSMTVTLGNFLFQVYRSWPSSFIVDVAKATLLGLLYLVSMAILVFIVYGALLILTLNLSGSFYD